MYAEISVAHLFTSWPNQSMLQKLHTRKVPKAQKLTFLRCQLTLLRNLEVLVCKAISTRALHDLGVTTVPFLTDRIVHMLQKDD